MAESSLFPFGDNLPSRKHSISFKGSQSRTKQAFRDGTRIDTILKRYATLGVDATIAPHLFQQNMARMPFGVDVGRDYHAQLNAVVAVREYFEALPSRVRARFGNDPGQLLSFLSDEGNRKEAEELGLVVKPDVPPVVTPAPGGSGTPVTPPVPPP